MAGDVGAADAVDPQVDVTVAVDVVRRRRFEMEVGEPGVAGVRPQRVLAPDRVRQRLRQMQLPVRTAQPQLRRIAYSDTLLEHVDAGVEDREIDLTVAVEVARDHDRAAHVDRACDQLRRVPEAAVPDADERAERRLRQAVLSRGVILQVLGRGRRCRRGRRRRDPRRRPGNPTAPTQAA